MRAVFNTPDEHNLVVCTLCSCYPWSVLGLPPVWYKAPPYRSRAVIDPRGVLAEFGLTLDPATAIRVWDSTAELRYLVVPMRPEGSEGLDEAALAGLVTRDSMIGTGLPLGSRMNGPQDLGGQMGFGPVAPETDEPVFHAEWERRALALTIRAGGDGRTGASTRARHARESLPPADYYASSYYAIWTKALERLLVRHGFVTEAELAAGAALDAGHARRSGCCAAPRWPAPIARGDALRPRPGRRRRRPSRPATAVRTVVMHPPGHTRLPRYARGKLGTRRGGARGLRVSRQQRAWPRRGAAMALHRGLRRRARSGARDADPTRTVSIDAWESYLERA